MSELTSTLKSLYSEDKQRPSKPHNTKKSAMSSSTNPVKYFYKGSAKDFVIFVENEGIANKYLQDSTVPLSEVVGKFKVFTSVQGRGSEGVLEEASKQELDSEFGSKNIEDAIHHILKEGTVQHSTSLHKKAYSSTNDANGASNHF